MGQLTMNKRTKSLMDEYVPFINERERGMKIEILNISLSLWAARKNLENLLFERE